MEEDTTAIPYPETLPANNLRQALKKWLMLPVYLLIALPCTVAVAAFMVVLFLAWPFMLPLTIWYCLRVSKTTPTTTNEPIHK